MGRPPVGGMADMRAFRRRRALVVALLVLVVAGAVAAVVLASGGGSSGAAGGTPPFDGTIYVESNAPAPDTNSVLAFRYRAGSLRPLSVREYSTGGTGSHDLSNRGVLDAESQITTNADRTLLFAVNAGSDTVAVFHIAADGGLTPVKGSPFSSRGKAPASVGVAGNTLYVANKAQDGIRDLERSDASYVSFAIAADGSLSPSGNAVEVPPKSSPTEAYPVPGKPLMIATEESGPWRVFRTSSSGTMTSAPGGPVRLAPQVLAPLPPDATAWPQGIAAHPTQPLVYAGVANARKLVTYSYDDQGRLTVVNSQRNRGAILPCWTEINRAGTRLYTGNAGSLNISVYDIGTAPRKPRQIQRVRLKSDGGNPWNFQIDPTGRYLYMLNMRAIRQVPPGTGNTLHSFRIGADGRLTELPSSPVPVPVRLGTNPWGIAVVPRR
jgi:6-phosphogluconolactonase (cycloisomerase 2 family)